jgi:WD40 repeat protein
VTALGDGRLASASEDNTVRVWDASSGVCLRVLEGHTNWVNSVTALGDGRLASASEDNTVRVWDVSSGVCLRVLEGHTGGGHSVTSLGDGRLASASNDNTVRVWDASSGVCLRVLVGHTDAVWSIAALSDGRLVSASDDTTVRVWDASSGVCLETIPFGSRLSDRFARVLDNFSRHAELATLALPCSQVPAPFYYGRTSAHFAPWGAPSVYLGADIAAASVFRLPDGRRFAAAGLSNGQVHVLEVIEPTIHNG